MNQTRRRFLQASTLLAAALPLAKLRLAGAGPVDAPAVVPPGGMKAGSLVVGNLKNVPGSEEHATELSLRPWEARVYRF